MQKFSILLVLALIALACGGGENAPSEAPPTATNAAAKKDIDVKKIWKVRCIACHGLYGDMGTNGAANLQESEKPLEYRINIIKNGSENGVMTPFGDILSEDEIKAMAEYTMTFKKE
ncbi:cytochrome c [Neolewinella lacunae]|uniref:Cytochrome c n=1 Tax=Neolewinella lacunae TaxID=1517758 RepID=A0A923PPW1_9BACT|nr:cytochrome c [Neolewinella lacunae]MBC6996380.1 cytochrome c [Neolewinella lacunae]MDN3633677.1 cytochrome c [Neolewinella lacunae]